jgi:ribonuclease R
VSKDKAIPFPTKQQVVDFIRESPTPVGKREIARAFQISGADRVPLKSLIKEIEDEGLVERGRGRKVAPSKALREVAIVLVEGVDTDGEVVARPARWEAEEPPPTIYMAPQPRGHAALTEGDRVLARLRRLEDGVYEGRTIRKIGQAAATTRMVGVYRHRRAGGEVEPADKRKKQGLLIAEADRHGAADGELVIAELAPGTRDGGPKRGVIVDRLGDADHPRAVSLIAIHGAGIPTEFPQSVLAEAQDLAIPTADGRADLRGVPLVTIDGPDARDFDDAVWAEADGDPANPGGWHLIVAIADVAHYVRARAPLDKEAYRRGNSCYFPDRVVPMLPEALSNGVCSLKPEEDRGCLAAHIWIDAEGRPIRHRFERGLMRSAARLTYEQVQAARNGDPDPATGPLLEPVITPLYGAFACLAAARDKRGTLELDLPETMVRLDHEGRVAGIGVRSRLDSHRLIEEFMIAANVAAAETLTKRNHPCLFRVHDSPDKAKLHALAEFLEPLGYRLAKGQVPRPRAFTQILKQAEDRPEQRTIHEVILRSQAQAIYSPENIGHFGLALPLYAHFTSPIRRYADLTVHRALISALDLGDGGADGEELSRLAEIGEHISFTERRAASAERDAMDRYLAAYMAERVGGTFEGRITGVTRFGLFVTAEPTGADGLVPISTLPDDFYQHDERAHALTGQRWGRVFRLGAAVRVQLVEADPITGSTVFALLDAEEGADWAPAEGRRGRGPATERGGARRDKAPRDKHAGARKSRAKAR